MLGKMKILFEIYITFLKLGSMSFGGGYAMLSLMEREVVEEKKWVDKEKIVDIFAVAESLPGAIALNSSAFVGFSIAGISGAVTALVGNLSSPVAIVLALSLIYNQIKDLPVVVSAFTGIYPAIVGLILYAAYKIGKTAIKDSAGIVISLAAFSLATFLHQPPIPLILSGALSGLALKDVFTGIRQKNLPPVLKGSVTILVLAIIFSTTIILHLGSIIITLASISLLIIYIILELLSGHFHKQIKKAGGENANTY